MIANSGPFSGHQPLVVAPPGPPPDPAVGRLRDTVRRIAALTANRGPSAADPADGWIAGGSDSGDDGGAPHRHVIRTACRWANDAGTLAENRDALSDLAYQLSQAALQPFDPDALHAARLRATVLAEHGRHGESADIWVRLIVSSQLTHQPALERQARLAYAVALHHAGQCRDAVDQLDYAWQTAAHRPAGDEPTPAAVRHVYLAVLAACRLDTDRAALLSGPAAPADSTAPGVVVMPATAEAHRPVCAYTRVRQEDRR